MVKGKQKLPKTKSDETKEQFKTNINAWGVMHRSCGKQLAEVTNCSKGHISVLKNALSLCVFGGISSS